jgi:hypothetical protein
MQDVPQLVDVTRAVAQLDDQARRGIQVMKAIGLHIVEEISILRWAKQR